MIEGGQHGLQRGAALFLVVLALSCFPVQAQPARWPQFRGPHASGVSATDDFPVHFGPESNCVWSVAVPAGHSSPCLWDDTIFLTAFEDGKLLTLALDRRTGRERWRRDLPPGRIERGAQLSNPATGTPATDGVGVFVYFGAFGLACYDVTGAERWRKALPVPVTQHGPGTSPVLAGDLLLVNCDQDFGSRLLAVDQRTGRTVWQADRAAFRRGFSTPLLYPPEKPDQVIVAGTLRLVSYNLADGSERWSVSGLPNEMVSSPAAGEGLIFVAGWTFGSGVARMPAFDPLLAQADADKDGRLSRDEVRPGPAKQHFLYIDADKDGFATRAEYESLAQIFDSSRNAAFAVRPDGRGDVTASHVVWSQTRGLPYCPSPLCYDGRLFLVKNGGLASCFDAQTGKVFFQEERVGALGDYFASPIAAAGKIIVASQPGTVAVLHAGEQLEVLATNPLGEPIIATPALAANTLFVRTTGHLFAFAESRKDNPPATPVAGKL